MDNIRYRIESKFADVVLLPANAIEQAFYASGEGTSATFITLDDQICSARWISTWRNSDGRYDELLDTICQERWKVPFVTIRSLWLSRIGKLDDFWHLIKLTKIESGVTQND